MKGRTVLIGVSGGIAAYKTCDLVSKAAQAGADVHVLMTANAARFVTPLTYEALSGNPVTDSMWSSDKGMAHIELADRAELMLIAPATADCIARLACGMADDAVTTTAITVECPILVAPAMNTRMYNNAATQANLKTLRDRGMEVLDSPEGQLACGTFGAGRMAEPSDLLAILENRLAAK